MLNSRGCAIILWEDKDPEDFGISRQEAGEQMANGAWFPNAKLNAQSWVFHSKSGREKEQAKYVCRWTFPPVIYVYSGNLDSTKPLEKWGLFSWDVEENRGIFSPALTKTKQSWECKAIASNQIWNLINLPQIASVLFGMLCCVAQVKSIPMDFTVFLMMSQSGGSALKAKLLQFRDHQIYFSVKKESFYLLQWGEI